MKSLVCALAVCLTAQAAAACDVVASGAVIASSQPVVVLPLTLAPASESVLLVAPACAAAHSLTVIDGSVAVSAAPAVARRRVILQRRGRPGRGRFARRGR